MFFEQWRTTQAQHKQLRMALEERFWSAPPKISEMGKRDRLQPSVRYYPSPYDVPMRQKMLVLPEGQWAMQWSYMEDGEGTQAITINDVRLKYGKRSGRLYEICALQMPVECTRVLEEWRKRTRATTIHQEHLCNLAQRAAKRLELSSRMGKKVSTQGHKQNILAIVSHFWQSNTLYAQMNKQPKSAF